MGENSSREGEYSRRQWLKVAAAAGAGSAATIAAVAAKRHFFTDPNVPGASFVTSQASDNLTAAEMMAKYPMPGPWPGKVVEIHNKRSVVQGKNDRAVIRSMLDRGLCRLFETDHSTEVWRKLFQPGDVVGIKVNPVGAPHVISSYEILLECIEGLKSAGLKPNDILVFDRYEAEFLRAGYDKILPEGVRWEGSTKAPGDASGGQLDIEGYDPDEFVTLNFCDPDNHDLKDERIYRSHLSLIVSRKVNKIICLPCLKDHGSGGVTGCLKNMSHGFVNNVARTHAKHRHLNQCGTFIPAVCSMPKIRQKVVLQILDGLRGVYEGGPFPGNWPIDPWYHHSLFVATDPVALDKVCWQLVNTKRAEKGLCKVEEAGKLNAKPGPTDNWDFRQPQHIALAATLGLGYFDDQRVQHRREEMA